MSITGKERFVEFVYSEKWVLETLIESFLESCIYNEEYGCYDFETAFVEFTEGNLATLKNALDKILKIRYT